MKKFVIAISAALAFSGVAGAQKYIGSPAQDLFDQAAFFLETQYFGPSKISMADLIIKYQAKVDEACASTQLACKYEAIEPILGEMFDEIQDPHAYYQSSASVRAEQQQATGNVTTPTPRLGFSHAGFVEYQKEIIPVGGFSAGLIDLINKGEAKLLSQDRMIVNVTSGSPAQKAGFRYGDRWIGYNGTLFSSFTSLTEYTAFLTGLTPKIAAREKITMNFSNFNNYAITSFM